MGRIADHAPSTPERELLIAERQRLGHDRRDEIWEGHYVMSPVGNGKHARLQADITYTLRAPASERGLTVVAEILVIDPMTDSVQWYRPGLQTYLPVTGSDLLGLDDAAVAAELS